MIKINKIVWDFSDTEFEDCNYEDARRITILPASLKIKPEVLESDADEEEIIEYLSENFGFCVESIEIEDD
jgi:hypothetical protein